MGSSFGLRTVGQRGARGWYRIAVLLCCLWLTSAAAQEKKLTIYAPQSSFSVALTERDGKDYAALEDLLQPLGKVTISVDGPRLKLRFNPGGTGKAVDAQFTAGSGAARVRGRNVDLAARFVVEDGRGWVPVHALPALLSHCFEAPIEFHERGRRLFIGNPAVHYSAELKGAPPRLVLSFTAPVNPAIASEPGRLRLVFTREPLVSTTFGPQALQDRTLSALSFEESNGAAELAVASSAPLQASFSDGGRTVTVVATPLPPPAHTEVAPAPVLPRAQPMPPQAPRMLVVIDPGHGGADSGAALGDTAEKDFNLTLARRLRAELEGRGIRTLLLRDDDTALALQQRALLANGARAAAYIGIHAAASGNGVRVYVSDVAPAAGNNPFLPFASAQAAYVDSSSLLAGGIAAELGRRQVASRWQTAPVRPLNSVAAAAVALEVAPPQDDAQGLASAAYQQSICSAVGTALSSLRVRLEAAR